MPASKTSTTAVLAGVALVILGLASYGGQHDKPRPHASTYRDGEKHKLMLIARWDPKNDHNQYQWQIGSDTDTKYTDSKSWSKIKDDYRGENVYLRVASTAFGDPPNRPKKVTVTCIIIVDGKTIIEEPKSAYYNPTAHSIEVYTACSLM